MPPVVAIVATFAANATIALTGSALAGIAVGNFIAANLVRMTLVAGLGIYSNARAKKAAAAMRAGLNQGRTVMLRQAITPRDIVYGQIRKSGPLVLMDQTGTKNEYLHMVVALAAHQCQAIDTVYFNGEALTLDGSGNVTSPSRYSGYARVKKHLGTATQAADSDLVAESPRWTSAHQGKLVCYLYVRVKWSAEVFPTGWPNVSALVSGKLVYDSRTATTAYSSNWALCLADFLTDTRLGLGAALTEIDDDALQAAANIADEDVELADETTEKRYTINGQVTSDMIPGDVIDQMKRAGAGFCGYIGGRWVIHAGAYRAPTISLDEDDIRAPITIQTKISRADNFNAGKGVFVSPDNDWQMADYPPVTNATYEAQDDGVRIYQDFEWPFTTSNATAQRLTKIALERIRQPITVTLPCKLTAMQVQAGDNVRLSLTRMGWTNKIFEVESARFSIEQQQNGPALGYDLVLRETASGVWDWNNGEETTIDLAPNTNLPSPTTVAAPTSLLLASGNTEAYVQADGTVIPRIKATWTLPADEFVQSGGFIRVEFKAAADSVWIPWTLVRGDVAEEYITDVESGVEYDVRIRSENTLRAVSAWVEDSITTGQKTSAPANPTGVDRSFDWSTYGYPPAKYETATGIVLGAAWVYWDAPTDTDIAAVEVYTDLSTLPAPANTLPYGSGELYAGSARQALIYSANSTFFTVVKGYVRFWDFSGNKSDWVGSASIGVNEGYAGNIGSQDDDDVIVTGITVGGGVATPKILVRAAINASGTLTGGAAEENVDIALTNMGFSTKPDGPSGGGMTNSSNLLWRYDWDSASSTSTNARIVVFTRDGTNIAGSAAYRLQTEFYEV